MREIVVRNCGFSKTFFFVVCDDIWIAIYPSFVVVHLPPYSILYNFPSRLHPNDSFSQDSQGGVPKLSRVGVPGLWELISPDFNIQLERGLNQSCSSPWELFNAMLHCFCRRQEEVEYQLLVVGSQIANLTLSPFFYP